MDEPQNVLVLAIFGSCMVAVIVGYLIAWRTSRTAWRRAGSLIVAAVAGFAGLVMSLWTLGVIFPLSPDTGPWWDLPVFLLVTLTPTLGAFYISAKFIQRACRTDGGESKQPAPPDT